MKRIIGLMVLVALSMLVGCGGGGGGVGGGGGGGGGDSPPHYTVNAATGSDTTGDGVTISYKTISKALSMASPGDTVTVAPGTYDNVLGETFPIFIPFGVKLIGDEPNKGNGPTPTLIHGGQNVPADFISMAVIPASDTTISGFTITNDSSPGSFQQAIALLYLYSRITVKNNLIVGNSDTAIYVRGGGADSVISGNVIQNNSNGIAFVGNSGPTTRVENNIITQNSVGVEYDGPEALYGDLGGGATGSVGGNVIAGNTRNDLWISFVTPSTIYAANNFWDHVPPTIGGDGGGIDIHRWNNTTIITTGASLAP